MTRIGCPAVARALWIAFAVCAGCGGDARLGSEGETCGRTADCAAPLRCVDATCLSPARARHLIDARRGPAVPDGAGPATGEAPLGQGRAPADAKTPEPPPADAPGGAPTDP